MLKKIIFLPFSILILTGCVTTSNGFSSRKKEHIYNSTFEVLVKKPTVDNITYEKELPWDLVDFNYRNDEYYSIGTAFAINENELLSAFHVIPTNEKSLVYDEYYIRDREGNVFELDQITGFSRAKDYISFTVKDKVFGSWLDLEMEFHLNETVYSVGNAYGEGILLREGSLTGTIAESENGEWNYIKSSSDVNSGNSGWPLLNREGNVIAIVSKKKDNIAYSLPVKEIYNDEKNRGYYHFKYRYAFGLFPEKLGSEPFDFELELPMYYKDIITETKKILDLEYVEKMELLFSENSNEIFPEGKSSLEALIGNTYQYMPQVIFKDETSLKWDISGLEVSSEDLKDEGFLLFSKLWEGAFIAGIQKPESLEMDQIVNDSKMMMDQFLQGLRLNRKFAGQEIRILSYGKPMKINFISDRYEREWKESLWKIDYSDQVLITYSLPCPGGVFLMGVFCQSSDLYQIQYDYRQMLQFIELSYSGTPDEWEEFLELDNLPEVFKDITLLRDGDDLLISTGIINVSNPVSIFTDQDKIEITLDFDIFTRENETVWDVRRVVISEENSESFMVVYTNLKPHEDLKKDFHDSYDNVDDGKHPFNQTPFYESGTSRIGKVYSRIRESKGELFTLYLALEGKVEDSELEEALNNIEISIKN